MDKAIKSVRIFSMYGCVRDHKSLIISEQVYRYNPRPIPVLEVIVQFGYFGGLYYVS